MFAAMFVVCGVLWTFAIVLNPRGASCVINADLRIDWRRIGVRMRLLALRSDDLRST